MGTYNYKSLISFFSGIGIVFALCSIFMAIKTYKEDLFGSSLYLFFSCFTIFFCALSNKAIGKAMKEGKVEKAVIKKRKAPKDKRTIGLSVFTACLFVLSAWGIFFGGGFKNETLQAWANLVGFLSTVLAIFMMGFLLPFYAGYCSYPTEDNNTESQ